MIRLSMPVLGDDEFAAVERVLRSGQLVHGGECDLFEQELAEYLGCRECVVVSSGTAALHLALLAIGIGPGDAVVVPDFTFPATVNVVELVGARPILVDVDPGTYNVTPAGIAEAIDAWSGPEKVRAIMPVHEFGCPADMTGITAVARQYGLSVIEDAACGLGTRHNGKMAGTFGAMGCFSFHPRKALTTGEGGAIAIDDLELATKIRTFRNHGIERNAAGMDFIAAGFNYRLTNFQAALGRAQLPKFAGWLQQRWQLQAMYRQGLADVPVALPDEVAGHAWQTFMVVLPAYCDRNTVIARLRAAFIETNVGAQCIHCLKYYRSKYPEMCQSQAGNVAERLYTQGLALPLYKDLEAAQIDFIVSQLRRIIT